MTMPRSLIARCSSEGAQFVHLPLRVLDPVGRCVNRRQREVVLLCVVAHVGEGKHRNRRLA
jgi:hypothetical protein